MNGKKWKRFKVEIWIKLGIKLEEIKYILNDVLVLLNWVNGNFYDIVDKLVELYVEMWERFVYFGKDFIEVGKR